METVVKDKKNIFNKFSILIQSRQGEACKDKKFPSKTPRSVNQFWIFENLIFWLRAALHCAESLISRISRENEFVIKTISAYVLGARMGWINEIKKVPKNLVTLPL